MEEKNLHPAQNAKSNTILIVDDDAINRKILGKIFSEYYTIQEAGDGQEGVDQLLEDEGRFCAVLLDVLMPRMSGIEVLRWMYMRDLLEKIPVFLITADRSEDMMKEAYKLGVMDVIQKPMVSYVVLRRVRSVIELFEARKHLRNVVESQSEELLKQAEKIIELNQGMIEALATAIEFRNEESGGHVQRIARITRIMLENTEFGAGLGKEEINNIALAAIMHDVGKITIPDAVLTKPGKLTPEEYEVMKSHTTRGETILERIPQLRDGGIYEYACDIARHHHERWDGKGYPDGLAGEEISPWAQVVSLADVYDALSCRRVYKPPFPRELVLEMIQTGQCGQFNPRLLESFLTVEDQLYQLYENLETPVT
ncbi:MAG: HD domain-containing protein [Roseburia sp.]|nr:HD domain-containing protein [Roseburia sp.]MCM1096772.1 HD domain-containing protein [Ruminococcus flavefaciens]